EHKNLSGAKDSQTDLIGSYSMPHRQESETIMTYLSVTETSRSSFLDANLQGMVVYELA
ncbi:hypothetical protein CHS0354_021630, partial [Potamilus streckersoni]